MLNGMTDLLVPHMNLATNGQFNINQITNAYNRVAYVESKYKVVAVGAMHKNGFAGPEIAEKGDGHFFVIPRGPADDVAQSSGFLRRAGDEVERGGGRAVVVRRYHKGSRIGSPGADWRLPS